MASVSLPCFEGYDQFVIWSTQNSVSRIIVIRFDMSHLKPTVWIICMFDKSFDTQLTSCYGLLSTDVINNPVPTGTRLFLPFYSGCRYAAFPARSDQEVKTNIFFLNQWYIGLILEGNCYILPWETNEPCVPWESIPCFWYQGITSFVKTL